MCVVICLTYLNLRTALQMKCNCFEKRLLSTQIIFLKQMFLKYAYFTVSCFFNKRDAHSQILNSFPALDCPYI